MGFVSEIGASIEAKNLEKVLVVASIHPSLEVVRFCVEQIVPLYRSAIDETFGYEKENTDLLKSLEERNNL